MQRSILVVWLVVVGACVKTASVSCSDGRVCPTGNACDEVHHTCVLPDQLTSCNGAADGTPCTVVDRDAVCNGGVCVEPFCGDAIVTGDEACDPNAPEGDCTALGYYDHGALRCNADCTYDTAACTGGRCGDGVVQSKQELCDVEPPSDTSCFDYGFDMGRLTCNSLCNFDFSTCSHIGWYSERQPDLGIYAQDIWGTSRNDIFVVAWVGKILHYDGSTWAIQDSSLGPFLIGSSVGYLYSVSGSATNDVWAVGSGGTILHYNGTAWSQTIAPSGSAQVLRSVWADASNDVFAVGDNGTIRHFDGSSWSLTTNGTDQLMAVWGRASNDVYAVGFGRTALHYNGATWAPMPFDGAVDASLNLKAVWGTSSGLYAVGTASNGTGRVLKLVSGTWNLMQTMSTDVKTLWASADDDIYVAGPAGVSHFDGRRWTLQDVSDTQAVWGSGATDVLGIGLGKIRRRGALSWAQDAVGYARAVTGTTRDDVFAFGREAAHWDGTSWSSLAAPPSAGFDAWAAASGEVFGVSHGGLDQPGPLTRWTSGTPTWTAISSSSLWLRGVWGASASDVYAVGGTARGWRTGVTRTASIVHYNGSTPQVVETRANDTFHAVWGSGPADVFVSSYRGQILHFNGASWTEQRAPAAISAPLKTLWGSGPDDVYAAGEDLGGVGPIILHYDGVTWTSQEPGLAADLDHLAGWGRSDIYATTKLAGVMLHSDGAQWVPVRLREEGAPVFHGSWAVPFSGSHSTRMFFVGYTFDTDDRVYQLERSCDSREQLCGDRADDDCDGLVDCVDTDCAADASCTAGGLCRPAVDIACGASVSGDTRQGSWRIDSYRGTPRPETGPEIAYRFTAAASGLVTLSLGGFTGDLDVLVVPSAAAGGCAPTSTAVAAASTNSMPETLTFTATAGTTYYLVVDGHDRAYGEFELGVTCN